MAQPSRASHYNGRLVGDEVNDFDDFDLAFRLNKHVREGNARQVDKMLAAGASIEGSPLVDHRPLMTVAGITMIRPKHRFDGIMCYWGG